MRVLKIETQPSNRFETILGKVATLFARLIILIITLLLCLPIILLPVSTSVPVWVWITLAITDLALIVLQFRFALNSVGTPGVLGGMIVIGLIAIAASQFFATTPLITDLKGQTIPGSIATLEKVNINETEQWITIRGQDVNKPILLHLGMGGPGGGGFATRSLFEPLEKDFVVVSWDEPGTGKSFNAVPISTLTPPTFC